MTFSLIQQANNFPDNFPNAAQPIITLGSSVTKGNLLIAWLATTGHPPVLSDAVNTWIPLTAPLSAGYGGLYGWYAISRRTGPLTVQFFMAALGSPFQGATPSSLQYPAAQVLEYSGNSINPVDNVTTNTGTSTAPSASISASLTNELVWAAAIGGGGISIHPGAGWTDSTGASADNYASIYNVESSSGSYSPTFVAGSSTSWGVLAVTFKTSDSDAYTISGSLGTAGANATVLFTSITTNYIFSSVANNLGNYISPDLPNDTYIVQAQLVGQNFSPASNLVTVSGSNASQNFTASSVNSILTLVSLGGDTFDRANENPVNPTNWPADGSPVPPWDPTMQIISDEATLADTTIYANLSGPWSAGGMSMFTGISWPTNSYVEVEIDALNSNSLTYAAVNLNLRTPMDIITGASMGIFNNGDGTCRVVCAAAVLLDSGTQGNPAGSGVAIPLYYCPAGVRQTAPAFINILSEPFSLGDTFAFAVVNDVYYAVHNGKVIGNYTDTTSYLGTMGGLVLYGLATTDVKVSQFKAGQATSSSPAPSAYSVPDCRDYTTFPNNYVNVQETRQYTVPAHPSHPDPVDSRKSKPVDSRINPNIPENSRTYPPFES